VAYSARFTSWKKTKDASQVQPAKIGATRRHLNFSLFGAQKCRRCRYASREGEIVGAEAAGKLRIPRGAALVEPVECRGVHIEGVTLRHFGVWTLHPTFCDDVAVVGVTFDTHGHNSDGIDPDSCRH